MSVDCEAKLMYGWFLEAEEIPDFRIHYENDWLDLFDMSDRYIVLNGEKTGLWPNDVIVCDNDYKSPEEAGWYVGIPLGNRLSKEEFMKRLDETRAQEIYKRVMGHEPDTAPAVLSFECWC